MSNSVMIDIETLDTEPTAVVLSLGVAVFNDSRVTNTTSWTFKIQPQIDAGHTISASTMKFWMDQDPDVRAEAFKEEYRSDKVNYLFNYFLKCHEVTEFWAYKPSFDYVILSNLWKGFEVPWSKGRFLDAYTLQRLTSIPIPRSKGHHNALIDAVDQANYVIRHKGGYRYAV
jgi:3' exoribonuclease, RNase T-like